MSAETVANAAPYATSLLCSMVESCQPDVKYRPVFLHRGSNDAPFSSFKDRLKTYKPCWWSSKPIHWSPWHCAVHGWVCVEKDLLQCYNCHKYLSSHVPNLNVSLNVYHKCSDKFHKSIIGAHEGTCSCRSQPTDLAQCTPNISDRTAALNCLVSRCKEVDNVVASFPGDLQLVAADTMGIQEDLKILATICGINCASKKALLIALFGWSVSSDGGQKSGPILFCDQCNRSIGLWLFCEKSTTENLRDAHSSSPKAKRFRGSREEVVRQFSPLSQHYSWCPWLQNVDHVSSMYNFVGKEHGVENNHVPRWRALIILILKPMELEYGDREDKQLMLEHFVLAKSLLDEAISKIERSENSTRPTGD